MGFIGLVQHVKVYNKIKSEAKEAFLLKTSQAGENDLRPVNPIQCPRYKVLEDINFNER